MKKKNILFVCKYNRFRSQVAEKLFKKYNKNKGINAESGGVFKGEPVLYPPQVKISREFGIKINKKPQAMSYPKLWDYDLIIIVANDVPKNLFKREGKYDNKIIEWKIKDNYDPNKTKIRRIVKDIEKKVKMLVKKLK
tara:strand:+ start:5337 stop:5750 length:414 start_codon:yes stop_codon:yes gene_type:complete